MWEMTQAYQGYFKNGRFMPLELDTVIIPDEIEVYIIVTGRKVSQKSETTKTTESEKERAFHALNGILADTKEI